MRGEDEGEGPRLLGICGSLRRASSNALLIGEAARAFGPCRLDRADIRFPLYDGDAEEAAGVPAEVMAFADALDAADAVVIATSEYNKALPGGLKNALDWLSRTRRKPLADKPLAIVSAAAGASGGARAQFSLRHCLTAFQPRILQGPEVMIAGANAAFDADGRLKDPRSFELLSALMGRLAAEISRGIGAAHA